MPRERRIRWYTRRSIKVGVAAWQRDQELLRVLNDLAGRVAALETKRSKRKGTDVDPV